MNEIVNKFLLVGDKFMPEMHLKQPGFTYSACGPFTKKQRKNWKVYADWKYRFYLKKWAWLGLFSTWYGLRQIKKPSKKNTIR